MNESLLAPVLFFQKLQNSRGRADQSLSYDDDDDDGDDGKKP